jgi:DNA-nicking Smr family endonuclease
MTRSPGKALNDEDRILWNLVARTATPLKGRKVEPLPEPVPIATIQPEMPTVPEVRSKTPAAPKSASLQAALDRQTHDKLAAGRLPIEARVDLHDMTQDQAYGLLLSFLGRAHAAGLRYVLVITGKGSSSGGDGVLRRAVPHWIATPPFRPLVSGLDPAARKHGGSGALYVRLRRKTPR